MIISDILTAELNDSNILIHTHTQEPLEKEKDVKYILYIDDLPNNNKYSFLKDRVDSYENLVFLSYWQKNQFCSQISIPHNKCSVIYDFIDIKHTNISKFYNKSVFKITFIVKENIHLMMIHEIIKNCIPSWRLNMHLYVYNLYHDKNYTELYEEIENHPNMTYNRVFTNDEILKTLCESHIFIYFKIDSSPSIISIDDKEYNKLLLQAMSVGCICIHNNTDELDELSKSLNLTFHYNDNSHDNMTNIANKIVEALQIMIEDTRYMTKMVNQRKNILKIHNYDLYIRNWKSIINQYRKIIPVETIDIDNPFIKIKEENTSIPIEELKIDASTNKTVNIDNTADIDITPDIDKTAHIDKTADIDNPYPGPYQDKIIFTCTTYLKTESNFDKFCYAIDTFLNFNTYDLYLISTFLIVVEYHDNNELYIDKLKKKYSNFIFIVKNKTQHGHSKSINIIIDKIRDYDLWLHWEESWYCTGMLLGDAIKIMKETNVNNLQFTKRDVLYDLPEIDNEYLICKEFENFKKIEAQSKLKDLWHTWEINDMDWSVWKDVGLWPFYSLRPSISRVKTILKAGYHSDEKIKWPFQCEFEWALRWVRRNNIVIGIMKNILVIRDDKNHISTYDMFHYKNWEEKLMNKENKQFYNREIKYNSFKSDKLKFIVFWTPSDNLDDLKKLIFTIEEGFPFNGDNINDEIPSNNYNKYFIELTIENKDRFKDYKKIIYNPSTERLDLLLSFDIHVDSHAHSVNDLWIL